MRQAGEKAGLPWELVIADNCWIGINTGLPNMLISGAIKTGLVPELKGYETIRPGVRYGTNSRIDFSFPTPWSVAMWKSKT